MIFSQDQVREVLASLEIPLPILETPVKQLRVLKTVSLTGSYLSRQALDRADSGQVLKVTGISVDGVRLQVECPSHPGEACWIPNETDVVQEAID